MLELNDTVFINACLLLLVNNNMQYTAAAVYVHILIYIFV